MKIAIIGAHGTGKSTLSEEVHKKTGLPRIQEVARDIMQEMGKIPQDMTREERVDFQKRIYDGQIQKEVGDFVSDRGLYDNMAYMKETDHNEYEKMLDKAMYHTGYDLVVLLCPGEFEIDDDGVRFIDPAFQIKIHNNILDILDILGVSVHKVSGSIEKRTQEVLSLIKLQGKQHPY